MRNALADLAAHCGIAQVYRDTTGTDRQTAPESTAAALAAMGLAAETSVEAAETLIALRAAAAARALPEWIVVETGTAVRLDAPEGTDWHLTLEDGTTDEGRAGAEGIALPTLPLGLHRLHANGGDTTLLCAPAALPLPDPGWGITLPLYGLRTAEQGGYGDYADLAAAVLSLGGLGAGFVGINPIHAGFPEDPQAFSPYAPSSRRRLSIAHIHVPGTWGTPGDLIDYASDLAHHRASLEAAFAALSGPEAAAFDAWRTRQSAELESFATHQALSEMYGPYWQNWPENLQLPSSPEVAAFASAHTPRLAFHAWAQWMAETQLDDVRAAATGMAQGLYLDLAVGTHPGGAETWEDPAAFARGVSLGAPPDAFSPSGQSWGIAPLNPRTLVANSFQPLAEALRAQFRFARLLRIDHILGFDRAFWVPEDGATPGVYVAMPRDAMLAVARIEAARAGATVIGEDLGNIPEGLHGALAASGILGCRVAMFERDPWQHGRFRAPESYDRDTLAAFGSHDLPTWAGWRQARDIAWRENLGEIDALRAADARARRAHDVAAMDTTLGRSDGDVNALHGYLAASAARLVAVQAEDVLGLAEQPNLPGTVHTHPNWRRRLPAAAGELGDNHLIQRTSALMRAIRPAAPTAAVPKDET